jgi:enediyne biosynthesis protein E4
LIVCSCGKCSSQRWLAGQSRPHRRRLYRNDGDGKFVDVTESSGIADASPAHGLGVLLTDLDGDGRIDIYVVNDLRPAYLFHNKGDCKFVEKALYCGCALGSSGENIAGMGVDAVDVDESGRPSLFVTNFHFLQNVLYLNTGGLLFHYGTHRSGLGRPSIDRLGFGLSLVTSIWTDDSVTGQPSLAIISENLEWGVGWRMRTSTTAAEATCPPANDDCLSGLARHTKQTGSRSDGPPGMSRLTAT